MSISTQRGLRVVCDGPCQVCRYKIREKSVLTQGLDILYYCRTCQQKYLCKDVLGRVKGEYSCPSCGSVISEMTVERANQLGLAFGYQLSRTSIDKRPVEQIKRTWFYSVGEVILKKDFVNELIELESLTVMKLIDLLYHADIAYRPSEAMLDKKRLLWDLFAQKPAIIRSIHNSLITRAENRRVDLILRALIDHEAFGCTFLSTIIPSPIAGTIDLIGIDEKTGELVWFIVHEEKIDEQIINTLLNELLSLPPLEFMGVSRIILLTKKWIWMGAEIARKMGKIQTRWKEIKLELFEEDPLFFHKAI